MIKAIATSILFGLLLATPFIGVNLWLCVLAGQDPQSSLGGLTAVFVALGVFSLMKSLERVPKEEVPDRGATCVLFGVWITTFSFGGLIAAISMWTLYVMVQGNRWDYLQTLPILIFVLAFGSYYAFKTIAK